ncbi:hypothetical protein HYH03_017982 [Edaphochlamys debaryana]|uniref:Uncharacterized protein n=1 Tax=Edaphochlamys debaryana TaxID=47281 RepID=A0A835XG69_9CHLO|nr:hypothetical protein HYH03_017982 [Edaphochlamys debaryana]|eukprot:KAG2483136.1 hypothetical protein HYH03_017982 [Edaphochlamys debaryana]
MHALDLLRVSRLFNPTTRFYLLADLGVVEKNAYHQGQLAKLNLQIRNSTGLRGPGSRAAQYDALHYQNANELHPPEMLSRFCEMADLAKAEGLERILTVDADQGLFTDVYKAFQLYQEDIVTPCYQCSQIVLWSTKALDAYCDGLLTFWRLNETDRQELFTKYRTERDFNDMHFLDIFIKGKTR